MKPTYGRESRVGAWSPLPRPSTRLAPSAHTVGRLRASRSRRSSPATTGAIRRRLPEAVPDYQLPLSTGDVSGAPNRNSGGILFEAEGVPIPDVLRRVRPRAEFPRLWRKRVRTVRESLSSPHRLRHRLLLSGRHGRGLEQPRALSTEPVTDGVPRTRRPSAEMYTLISIRRVSGPEVKRRILLGTFVLSAGYYDAYYRKAQQVRSAIAPAILIGPLRDCDLIVPRRRVQKWPFGWEKRVRRSH